MSTIKERVMLAGETKICVVLIQSPSVGLVLSISEAHELVEELLNKIEVAQENRKKQQPEIFNTSVQK